MFFRQLRSASVLSPRRWPLPALAALLILLLAAALLWAAAGPAGAQDGYQPDQQVVDDVWSYARETDNGFTHVLRWMQVLHTLGAIEAMSAAEARDNAGQFWAARWDPVAGELAALEAQDDYVPDQQVVDDVWSYARETDNGFTHVLRWMRVLHTLGAIEDMTSAEARDYADQYLAARWNPVANELAALEAAAAVPAPTATPEPTPEPTQVPNQAPVVNTQAKRYAAFTGDSNAPRGVLVWKRFQGIFSDPDGDELTYSAAVTQGRTELVQDLDVRPAVMLSNGEKADMLFLIADADGWKSLTSSLPNPQVITVTLTATDPGGLSASVSGEFSIEWWLYPEVVSARADGAAIELTFDWAVEANPAPNPWQFTVNVVNEDGATGTIAVESVSVNGKVVTLELASALDGSQTVTVDYNGYNYLTGTPLQRAGGGDNAPSFSGQAVEILRPPGEPQNFVLSAGAGSLDISAVWDALDGAASYKLRWRLVGGEFEAANAATVTDTSATITVPDYGEWEVRLQGCNDTGCGPEAEQTVTLAALSPPENFAVSAERGSLDLWAKWDAAAGATFYRLRWRQPGGQFTAANTTTVTDTKAAITMPESGEWEVWLQACSDAGCVPEAGQSADEDPVVRLNLDSSREAGGQAQAQAQAQARARAQAFTATSGPVEDGTSYTLGWRRDGTDPQDQAPSQPDAARQTRATGGPSGAAGQGANGLADTTPPVLVEGHIDSDTMTFWFSEPLDETATGSQFRVTLSYGSSWFNFTAHPSRVEVSGNKVTLVGLSYRGWPGIKRAGRGHVAHAYYYKDDRVAPAGERLQDLAGNEVSTPHRSLGGHFPATRTIWLPNLTAPAVLKRATAHPDWLTLTFDGALDHKSVPSADVFTATVNGSAVSLASVNPVYVSGDTVTLVLDSPLTSSDTATVSYAKPSRDRLRDVDGDVKNFSGRSVTNLVGAVPSVSDVSISSTPADGEAYAPGETIQVSLTFTEAVTVDTTGGAPRLKLEMAPNYGVKWANYAGGSGTTMLTFNYTVVEPDRSTRGVAVPGGGLSLNGGAVRSTATQQEAHLWYPRRDYDPDHMVDWHRSAPGVPWVIGVAITSNPGDDDTYALGDTIQLTATFSEAVNVDTTGGTPRLRIRMAPHLWWFTTDDKQRWADYSGGSGTAELTFDYTVAAVNRSNNGVAVLENTLELNGGTIRSVAMPATDAHLRYGGKWHDPNHQVDGKIPSLQGVTVADTTISLAYDKALDMDSVPPASAFTVKRTPQSGTEETVGLSGSPVIAAGAVLLTLDEPVLDTDTGVRVSYDQPGPGSRLQDHAGNAAASFSNHAVDAIDTTPPRLVRGEVKGDTMTIYFSEPLDENIRRDANRFRIGLLWEDGSPSFGRCGSLRYTFHTRPREIYIIGNTAVVVGFGELATTRASTVWTITNFGGYYADITTPVEHRIRDLSGNLVSTPRYVDEQHRKTRPLWYFYLYNDTRLPSPERATVVGNRLTLTFDAPLRAGQTPAASAFTVTVGGSQVSLASANAVSVSGRTVTLTLASAVAAGADVTVSYERPSSRWLRNVICEYAPSFSGEPVSNYTGVSPASAAVTSDPGDDNTYGLGDVIRVRLTFSEAVTVSGAPRLKIRMGPDYGDKWARYESGSGTSTLTFAYKVVEPNTSPSGVAVLANTLGLRYGTIRYASSGDPAYLAHAGLSHDPAHKVDWRQ